MAPSLEAPMTQPLNTPAKRPRHLLPIIPAIPRVLERKSKQEPSTQPVKEKTEEKAETPEVIEIQQDGEKDNPAASVHALQNGMVDGGNQGDVSGQDVEQTIGQVSEESSAQSPNATQDFGIEKHGFKLPPPFYPRSATPVVIPTDFPTMDLAADVLNPSSPVKGNDSAVAHQEARVNYRPLRAEASSFHAHPAPTGDPAVLSIGSHESGSSPAENQPIVPQPTPPTDATSPPTQLADQGHGHAHNLSFFPPPPTSPNGVYSPAQSVYQGYAYAPAPHGYVSHTHSASQMSQPYQPYTEAYASPSHPYGPQSPFYNSNPPFSALGSQPPLTPSATPLDTFPRQWKVPNGYSALDLQLDPNRNPENPERTEHTEQTEQPEQYRSASQNTLKSDHDSYRSFQVATTDSQPVQYDEYRPEDWRTVELDALQNARMNGAFNEAPLSEYLLYHFNDQEYADCRLILSHESKRFKEAEWTLSSLLVAQSRSLRDVLKVSKRGADGKRVLTVSLTDRFVTTTSMDLALRVMYGMPPNAFEVRCHNEATTAEISMRQMKESLAYAATGCLLHLKDIVLRGLQIASEIINWDNLEAALSFGLESGHERECNASSAVIPAYATLLARDSDPSPSNNVIITPSTSEDPAGQKSNGSSKSAFSHESYHRPPPQSAHDLLMHCLDFMSDNFPTIWELDLSARPLADVDRLPVTAESRSPLSKSRLSRIQFGSHPSEATAKSADRNVLISTILLSIPFEWLEYLFHLVGEPISRSIDSIIKERERRRHIVLQSQSVPWAARVAAKNYAWSHAGYEEYVKANDNGQLSMSRRYTGIAVDPQGEGAGER